MVTKGGLHASWLKVKIKFNLEQTTKTQKGSRGTRYVQWETGKVVLKIACTTDIIVCRVCEVGDLELPIDGVGTPAARIGKWETV